MIRQLSQIQDEEALDVLADLLEPAVAICKNEILAKAVRNNEPMLKIAQIALKANKKEVMQVLTILSDEDEYHCNAVSLLADTMTLLNDKELMRFFGSSVATEEKTSSQSSSENTEADEK